MSPDTLPPPSVTHQRRQHWALLPFLAGVLIGLAISTVLLVRPNVETVTNNVYINIRQDTGAQLREKFGWDKKFAEFDHLLEELHAQNSGPQKLFEEVKVRNTVFYAIVLPDRKSIENLKVLRNTWAKNIDPVDISFFVPYEETMEQGEEVVIEEKDDLIEISSMELLEVEALKYICQHKLNSTKWFFLSNDNIYIKTEKLESFLLSLETSQNDPGYLGKPIRRNLIDRVCMPGPGSVLSSLVLSELCPKLDKCSELQGHLETECVLGECVRKQLPSVQCGKDSRFHEIFLKFEEEKKGTIVDPNNHNIFGKAVTIFPVDDPKLMYSIHQLVVNQRLNDSQQEIQGLKQSIDEMAGLLPQTDLTLYKDQVKSDVTLTEDDIIAWRLINQNLLMSCVEHNPASKIRSLWKSELEVLSTRSMEYLNSHEEETYKFKRMVNVYQRENPQLGTEYIIDFEVKLAGTEADYKSPSNHFRASILRQYNEPEVNPIVQHMVASRHVSIGVLVTDKLVAKFQRFMTMLEKTLKVDQRFDLIAVEMKSAVGKSSSNSLSNLKSIISTYENEYPRANFKVLESSHQLSRPHGLSLLVQELRPNDVVFFSDLDLDFDAGFLDRCRNYPIQGQQVFFPIPFTSMDPSMIATMNHSSTQNTITQHSGHWLVDSYGVACTYAGDILSILQQGDHSNEVNLEEIYSKFVKKGYSVLRGADKGLKRWYSNERKCVLDYHGETHGKCSLLPDSYEKLYLKMQLSVLLLDHEGDHAHKKY